MCPPQNTPPGHVFGAHTPVRPYRFWPTRPASTMPGWSMSPPAITTKIQRPCASAFQRPTIPVGADPCVRPQTRHPGMFSGRTHRCAPTKNNARDFLWPSRKNALLGAIRRSFDGSPQRPNILADALDRVATRRSPQEKAQGQQPNPHSAKASFPTHMLAPRRLSSQGALEASPGTVHKKSFGDAEARTFHAWWAGGDSNPRLPPCEDGTLTAELPAQTSALIHESAFPCNRKSRFSWAPPGEAAGACNRPWPPHRWD